MQWRKTSPLAKLKKHVKKDVKKKRSALSKKRWGKKKEHPLKDFFREVGKHIGLPS